jgi:hypothetical protein
MPGSVHRHDQYKPRTVHGNPHLDTTSTGGLLPVPVSQARRAFTACGSVALRLWSLVLESDKRVRFLAHHAALSVRLSTLTGGGAICCTVLTTNLSFG